MADIGTKQNVDILKKRLTVKKMELEVQLTRMELRKMECQEEMDRLDRDMGLTGQEVVKIKEQLGKL